MGTTNLELDHIDRKVQFMIIHPKYDPKGNWGSYDSDLALLKFEEPVKFKPNVIPICLPDDDNEDFAGQIGWTTGWGQLHEKGKEFICISTKTIHYSANLKKKENSPIFNYLFCLIFIKIGHERCVSMDRTQLISYYHGFQQKCL